MAKTFHYLSDITIGKPNYIYTCQPFDKEKIKDIIVQYLIDNPKAEIEHSKDNKTYESFEILGYYLLNKQGKVCKSISKAGREFLIPIK